MKYMGMPMGMWALFAGSFQKQLTAVFILKRSDFSNSGRSAMIALYFGFAFFVIACAASAS